MAGDRIVVGAVRDADGVGEAARRLRDAGHEVVFVGGEQTPGQLARTAVAEDATRLVVDGGVVDVEQVVDACTALGASDIVVARWCDAFDAT